MRGTPVGDPVFNAVACGVSGHWEMRRTLAVADWIRPTVSEARRSTIFVMRAEPSDLAGRTLALVSHGSIGVASCGVTADRWPVLADRFRPIGEYRQNAFRGVR